MMARTEKGQWRAPIIVKIPALLPKTTEHGGWKPEALADAEKASELMERSRVSLTELESREEPTRSGGAPGHYVNGHTPIRGPP
jgi:hypothetical protein